MARLGPAVRCPRIAALAIAGLAALPACKDTPSYRVRWQLQPLADPSMPGSEPPAKLELTKAFECSSHGVTAVRVLAIDEAGFVAHENLYPCFAPGFDDPDEEVDGPELKREGIYVLEVRGVQRDDEPWIDQSVLATQLLADPDYLKKEPDRWCGVHAHTRGCRLEDIACKCSKPFRVVKNETFDGFAKFVLGAPPDCIDGIDNDGDGLVDIEDVGCLVSEVDAGDCEDGLDNDGDGNIDAADPKCTRFEKRNISVVQFTLRATLLDENPAADCGGIARFIVEAHSSAGDTVEVARPLCKPLGAARFFSAPLSSTETYDITVTAVGGDNLGNPPLTKSVVVAADVSPASGSILELVVDFGEETFDPPLVAAADLDLRFDLSAEGQVAKNCALGSGALLGLLAVDNVELELFDLDGTAVDGATLSNGTPLDGTPLDCPISVSTEPLQWGGYRLVARGLATDGTVCFSTGSPGILLAPNAVDVVLERVLVGDAPPPSCADCTTTADCEGGQTCTNGLCVD